ncbi:MAG: hypothetical protein N4A33_04810 [Bacteriovoracaceae bacterium]|jgi:hypothetical protein|nr:hypothetical protein [Bacteriovoracaceae bacterium]
MPTFDTRTDLQISGFRDTPMKVYTAYINPGVDDRVAVIYEAYNETEHNQDCRATVYVYHGTSDNIKYTFEKPAKWDEQWDIDAQAEATALGYWQVNGEV